MKAANEDSLDAIEAKVRRCLKPAQDIGIIAALLVLIPTLIATPKAILLGAVGVAALIYGSYYWLWRPASIGAVGIAVAWWFL